MPSARAKLRRSQERLRALGFFEKVDISAAPGSAPDKTNLEVQVVEQSTGEISFGAGYSTTAGIVGDISIKERNLLGKGQEVRLGLSLGTLSTNIDFSFTEPYFLDRNMVAGFDIFRTSNDRQSVANYSDASLGFALRSGWAYSEHTRQIVRYTLRQTNIYNVMPWASPVVQSQAGYATVSEISETIAWDTRDVRINTTKGLLLRNTIAVAGAIGTEQYVRTTADAVYFQSLGLEDVVISVGGSFGVVLPYNNTNIRLNNLFFLGGDNLRGFAVAVSARATPVPPTRWVASIFTRRTTELSFPLYGIPKELGLLGKAFVDTGSLWGNQAEGFGASVLDSHADACRYRLRHSMDIAVRADPGRLQLPGRSGALGQDAELPVQLRNPILSGDGGDMNIQTDKASLFDSHVRRHQAASCR